MLGVKLLYCSRYSRVGNELLLVVESVQCPRELPPRYQRGGPFGLGGESFLFSILVSLALHWWCGLQKGLQVQGFVESQFPERDALVNGLCGCVLCVVGVVWLRQKGPRGEDECLPVWFAGRFLRAFLEDLGDELVLDGCDALSLPLWDLHESAPW